MTQEITKFEKYIKMDDTIQNIRQLIDSGNLDEAERILNNALKQNPDSKEFLNLQAQLSLKLGSAHWEKGDVDRALDYLTQALEINPNDRNTVLKCGEVLTALEQIDSAKNLYSSYLHKNPDDQEIAQVLKNIETSAFKPAELTQEDRKAKIKVSAIVSTYNSERFMRGCLEDLLNQTLYQKGKLEIIVIDSGSQQNEKAIVEEFQKGHKNINYIRTDARESVYAAWNRGIKSASGDYITNSNTDDRHRKDALELMANILDRNPEFGLIYADVFITEKENETFDGYTPVSAYTWPDYSREVLSLSCFIGPQPMWRKSLHDKYGYFDESFVVAGDWEFWLRVAEGTTFYHIPEKLGLYLKSPASIEQKDTELTFKENSIIRRKYIPKYFPTFEEHFIRALEINPSDRTTVCNYAEILTTLERYDQAKNVYASYLQKNPKDKEVENALNKLFSLIKTSAEMEPSQVLQQPRESGIKVSAIVSIYNAKRFMRGCLEDLVNQTLYKKGELEIIVVDSGSKQNEKKIVKRFQKNYDKIKYIRTEKRDTVYAAWNRGIEAATGKYITNANADDRHRRDALEILSNVLDSNANIGLVYADSYITQIENETFESNTAKMCYVFPECNVRQALTRQFFGSQPMWRKSVHDQIGYFNDKFVVAGDYDFFIRLVRSFGGYHVPEFLGLYLMRSDSVEHANIENNIIELKRTINNYRVIIPLDDIYPLLKKYHGEKNAWAAAYVDMGNIYSLSVYFDFARAYLAYQEAEKICGSLPEISNNIAALLINNALLVDDAIEQRDSQIQKACRLLENIRDQTVIAEYNLQLAKHLLLSNSKPEYSNFILAWLTHPVVNSLPPVFINKLELPIDEGRKLQNELCRQKKGTSYIGYTDEKEDEGISYFQKALDEFYKHNFIEAEKTIELYRKTINYDLFHKIDNRINKNCAVSVIVVAYKTGNLLLECVASLLNQTETRFEIIVVDNGGNDEIVNQLNLLPILYIKSPINFPLSECRNIGTKYAKGDIIAFLDDDAIVPTNYVKSIIEAFSIHSFIGLKGKTLPKANRSVEVPEFYDSGDAPVATFIETKGNFAFLKERYQEFNGMNPLLLGEEGLDISIRISSQYGDDQIMYSPRTISFHDAADSKKEDTRDNVREVIHAYLENKYPAVWNEWKNKSKKYLYKKPTLSEIPEAGTAEPHIILEKDLVNSKISKDSRISDEVTPSKKPQFRVSAIVSTYNSERFIKGCLEDLVNQTLYKKGQLEIIVIDSGSQQNEKTVVSEFHDNYNNVIYLRTKHESVYAAWNRGLKLASGEYITNANTDDRHRHDALEVMADELDRNPEIALVYGDQIITKRENETFESCTPASCFKWPEFERECLLHIACIGPQPMWRKSLHLEFGYFREDLKVAGDYEWWLRISEKYSFKHIPELLGLYLLNEQGLERSEQGSSQKETSAIREFHMKKAGIQPQPEKYPPNFIVGRYESVTPEEKPLVSVIIPTRDRPEMLKEAIGSVLNQTYKNFEIVVVNDGGIDVDHIINEMNRDDNDDNIVYIKFPRKKGVAAARNTGIRIAQGKYIAYLDDDDIFYPDHVKTLVDFLESSDFKIAYADTSQAIQVKQQDNYVTVRNNDLHLPDLDSDMILVRNFIPTLCFIHEKSCLDKIGLFDESLGTHEDWDLWIRMSRKFRFGHIRKITSEYRTRQDDIQKTSVELSDFHRTRKIIYERYKNLVQGKHHLIAAQQEILDEEMQDFQRQPAVKSVSVIIVTFHSQSTIAECLDSVIKHSPEAEIIVVDNDSSDETRTILAGYKNRIKTILNDDNRGFSYACNQGIRASKGEYVILLNPDTIVTSGWVEHLIAHFRQGVGAVGPVSNYVAALQKAEFYSDKPFPGKSVIDEFAENLYARNRGQGRITKLLMGFCIMFPRRVLDEVGLMDEDLFLGNDDLEISWRLRTRGYKLIIATDTFVYHEGQVSFQSVKERPSTDESTQKLYSKLEAYYGAGNVPNPIELWGIDFFEPKGAKFKPFIPTFAAVYCVYDDDIWLRDSLESVYSECDAIYFLVGEKPWFGKPADNSTTIEIIRQFPDPDGKIRMVKGQWTDETEQRNAGLEILKKDGYAYCFVIDADEIYAPVELKKMKALVASHPEVDCWHITLHTYWKSYRYRIDPPEKLTPPVFLKVGSSHFTQNRLAEGEYPGLIPPEVGRCHHLSYARSDAEVLKKITTFSHAHEIRPGWFENVWKRWDSDHSMTNLHPTHPYAYQRAVEQPLSALPPVLQKHYIVDTKDDSGTTKELTSIIILAHNQWDQTELCLNSISKYTPEPHEIIIVDNSSTDETPERLTELVEKMPNLRVITNAVNRGFAAGNNQGMSVSKGQHILLLNNDTIVTEGWLRRMLAVFKRHPETGIVGPMSNYVSGHQKIDVDYEDISGIETFAERWSREYEGQDFPIYRVVGFCLLMRKDVMDRIGGLDEKFGSGNFEDDDFCIRASFAGYASMIARDVFIHHTGSQTFIGAGIDYRQSLLKNWELFKAKWGIPIDTPYERGYLPPTQLPHGLSLYVPLPDISFDHHSSDSDGRKWEDLSEKLEQKKRIKGLTSIIIPVKNQRAHVRKCLNSIKRYTEEPYEIIFLSINAPDDTIKWIRKRLRENPNYKIVENIPPESSASKVIPQTSALVKEGKREFSDSKNKTISYSKAFNQGINLSTGEFIVILNDNIVVTDEWLSGMIECLNSIADAGIIGPVSNSIEGPQGISNVDYIASEHLNEFASSFRKKNRYRRNVCTKLESFCILIRHKLIEKIGLLDERFESSCFTVEDYCLRAAMEGYRNLIAADIFIHFDKKGSNITSENDISFEKIDAKNFVNKWRTIDQKSLEWGKIFSVNALKAADELNQKGQKDNAINTLLEAIKLSPLEKRLHYTIAEILIENKKFRDCLDLLEKMPHFFSRDQRRLELIGFCKEGLKLYEEAEKYADEALAVNTSSAMAWNLKGLIAFNKGLNSDAEHFFNKAIESDKGYGEPYANIGALRWNEKKTEEAFDLFEKAFILTPTSEDIVINYHTAAVHLSHLDRAAKCFHDAMDLYPFNRRIKFVLIDILLQQQKFQEAMNLMENAMLIFGIDDDILSFALALREKMGPHHSHEPDKTGETKETRETVSLCIIVKNEESNIVRSLINIKSLVDEMIVVDTGSTDRTKDIAKAFGAKVYDFAWTGDFSEARNYSLSKATGRWILVLDADEVISQSDFDALRALAKKAGSKPLAYSFVTRNYVLPVTITGWVANDGKYKEEAGTGWMPSDKVRLFPNDSRIRFENPVHELVEPSLKKIGIEIRQCEIPIHHYGKLNKEKSAAKGQEYYQLGKKKFEEQGELSIKALYELGVQASELKRHEEALEYFKKVIAIKPDIATAHYGIGNNYFHLGRFEDALSSMKNALKLDPESRDIITLYSECELVAGNVETGIAHLEAYLERDPLYPMALLPLAAAYFCTGKKKKGLEYLKKLEEIKFSGSEYFTGFAKMLISNQRFHNACLLLEAALETKHANNETPALLEECRRKMEETQKENNEIATPPSGARNDPPLIPPLLRGDRGGCPIITRSEAEDSSLRSEQAPQSQETARSPLPNQVRDRDDKEKETISLCMIVKNEEENIGRCLENIKPLVDEIIVVDTGSTDRTKEIAQSFGAKVYDFKWTDSFSDARNFSLSKATGKWILILDADEIISPSDFDALRQLIIPPNPPLPKGGMKKGSLSKERVEEGSSEKKGVKEESLEEGGLTSSPPLGKGGQEGVIAYSFVTRNYVNSSNIVGWIPNDGQYAEEAGTGWFKGEKVRLFPNNERIHFEYPVHERIDFSILKAGIDIKNCDIPIHHYGKLDQEKSLEKAEIYYDMAKKKIFEQGETDVNALYEISVQAGEIGKYEDALEYLKKVISMRPDFSKAFQSMGNNYFNLGRYKDALNSYERALKLDPDLKDASLMLARCQIYSGNIEESIVHLKALLKKYPKYLNALALITAAYFCADKKKKGLEHLKKLEEIKFSGSEYFTGLAKMLISNQRLHNASLLLEAALETKHANNETPALLEECRRKMEETQKENSEIATPPSGARNNPPLIPPLLRGDRGGCPVIARSEAEDSSLRSEQAPQSHKPDETQETQQTQSTISLCMIVKNEEENIGRCLENIKPLVDEIIVVDTGSTDRTKEIAQSFGAKVYGFKWTDSFSDARNFSLSKATGKWILVLDADEVISPVDFDALRQLIIPPNPPFLKGGMEEGSLPKGGIKEGSLPKERVEEESLPKERVKEESLSKERVEEGSSEKKGVKEESLEGGLTSSPLLGKGGQGGVIAYSFVTRNYVNSSNIVGWIPNDGQYAEEAGTGWFSSEKVRLFPKNRTVHFEKPVHELVEFSLAASGIEIRKCDIPIHHYGTLSLEKLSSRGEEYYQLGKKKLAETGDHDVLAIYELAVQAGVLEKYEEALHYWEKILSLSPKLSNLKEGKREIGKGLHFDTKQLFGQAYFGIANAHFNLGRFEEALVAAKKSLEIVPDSKDAAILYNKCKLCTGYAEDAIANLEDFLKKNPEYPRAMALIAASYFSANKKEEGMPYVEKLKNINFDCSNYLIDFAKILMSAGRFDYAYSLFEAIIETKHANNETPALLEECRRKIEETQKENSEIATPPSGAHNNPPLIPPLLRGDRGGCPVITRSESEDSSLRSEQAPQSQETARSPLPNQVRDRDDKEKETLSLCMIVKNEEENIGRCLENIKPLVDEIIVVDTGSTDRTKEIAQSFGAKVYGFKWTDSFSDARNFSLSKTTGKWILVLDADEVISPVDFDALRQLIIPPNPPFLKGGIKEGSLPKERVKEESLPKERVEEESSEEGWHTSSPPLDKGGQGGVIAYSFTTRNYVKQVKVGITPNDGKYKEEAGAGWIPSDKVRLFPNDSRIRFDNPVHELVEPSLISAGIEIRHVEIPIHHYGKLKTEKKASKGEGYYNLGKLKFTEKGKEDIKTIYELAVQASELEKYEEAIDYWQKLIAVEPDFSPAFYGMGIAYFALGRYKEAVGYLKRTLQIDSSSRDAIVMLSTCNIYTGNPQAAIPLLENLLSEDSSNQLGLFTLAVAFICSGKKEKGIENLKKLREMNFNCTHFINNFAAILIFIAKRFDYALSLLETAKESGNTSNETDGLLAACYSMMQSGRI